MSSNILKNCSKVKITPSQMFFSFYYFCQNLFEIPKNFSFFKDYFGISVFFTFLQKFFRVFSKCVHIFKNIYATVHVQKITSN